MNEKLQAGKWVFFIPYYDHQGELEGYGRVVEHKDNGMIVIAMESGSQIEASDSEVYPLPHDCNSNLYHAIRLAYLCGEEKTDWAEVVRVLRECLGRKTQGKKDLSQNAHDLKKKLKNCPW